PLALAVAAPLALAVMWRSRYVSLGSLTGATVAVLAVAALVATGVAELPALAFAAIAGALVVAAHRDNVERLRAGTERRLGDPASASPGG
ncbi:MAG: glycerol-3-phosphate acyltransferase, partial [Chloroflexota bacterium]|nr:glycerol-3-phosphate acyltransferase [Chloroflexota bacterium]